MFHVEAQLGTLQNIIFCLFLSALKHLTGTVFVPFRREIYDANTRDRILHVHKYEYMKNDFFLRQQALIILIFACGEDIVSVFS